MSRRIRRVPVNLVLKDIEDLPLEEIKIILRGADDLINRGGRSALAKILKGSRESKILEHDLDKSPVYGYFKDLSLADITAKIDWLILKGYLKIAYDYRLPLLAYTLKGWEIEMDTYTDELIKEFDEMINSSSADFDMTYLKDTNREMILLLLDKVEETKDPRYIPLLKSWGKIDYKKVRQRINEVIAVIQSS
ncbi:RQC domain protein [candidate division KSB1 bacterium]|nr:RQC domain protein [candidate division KSB1 bacterium]